MTQINHDTLIDVGFQPCIFAPIYITRYTYYLGNIDWSLQERTIYPKFWEFWKKPKTQKFANNMNWNDATMLIAISADDSSYLDRSGLRFYSIEAIIKYCKKQNIEMTASKSPLI